MNQNFINDLALKLQRVGSLHAVGETWISIDSTIPAGGIPFLGQLVSRATWSDLFAWASSSGKVKTEAEWTEYADAHGGNCPFYSDGDSSTNFRMPCIKGYLKNAETLESAGGYIAEGLPNIEGTFGQCNEGYWSNNQRNATGPFSASISSWDGATLHNGSKSTIWSFDASKANPIYGNSTHVTPETNTILIGVYAVGIVTNVGSADATKFLAGLSAVEANLSAKLETSTVHIVETWSNGTTKYRLWSDGLIEQWGRTSGTDGLFDVTFPLAFSDNNYTFMSAPIGSVSNGYVFISTSTRSTTGINVRWAGDVDSASSIDWYVCGY